MRADEIDRLLDECKKEELEEDEKKHRIGLICYLSQRGKIKKPRRIMFKKVCPECGGKLIWDKKIDEYHKYASCDACGYEFANYKYEHIGCLL